MDRNSSMLYRSAMTQDILQVNFRMPAELKSRLEEAAAKNRRTLTAEILARLEASFRMGEAEESFRALGSDYDQVQKALQTLSSMINEITDHARMARRLTEPTPHVSKYGQIRDDDDLTIQPPPEGVMTVTREELNYLYDDEREARGRPRRFGPRPIGEMAKRLDLIKAYSEERRRRFRERMAREEAEEAKALEERGLTLSPPDATETQQAPTPSRIPSIGPDSGLPSKKPQRKIDLD